MFSTSQWTPDQWTAFTGVLVAGLAAVALAALAIRHVRAWTAPAHPALPTVRQTQPRPTLHLVTERIEQVRASRARAIELTGTVLVDPIVLKHLAPGPGSLTTLAEVGPGRLSDADPPVDPEVRAWFAEAFDRPAHVPRRDEARELDEGGVLTRFNVAIEGAMRTAKLWELRSYAAEHGVATASTWATLARWRIDEPTGEYALVPA